MAVNSLVALQGQNPQINAVEAFSRGQQQALTAQNMRLQNMRQELDRMAEIGLGLMGGKLDGEVNPQYFGQAMDMLEQQGMDPQAVAALRSRPDLVPFLTRTSLDIRTQLQQANSDRDAELAERTLQQRISEAFAANARDAAAAAKPTRQVINNQLVEIGPDGATRTLGDFRSDTQPAAPSGYQWAGDGRQEPIPGGPADPANRPRPAMNATVQKEIFEADEAVKSGTAVLGALDRALELNAKAWDGPFAEQRGYAGSLVGMGDAADTLELKNIITSQALDQLKATFGAMPTEGERKILLEIQGSVDQPREVRQRIFERARAAAERRIASNRQKAEGLRSGSYFDPASGQAGGGTGNRGTTGTGVQWSFED